MCATSQLSAQGVLPSVKVNLVFVYLSRVSMGWEPTDLPHLATRTPCTLFEPFVGCQDMSVHRPQTATCCAVNGQNNRYQAFQQRRMLQWFGFARGYSWRCSR